MRIGEAAECAGVNVQTLRYYQRRGLIPKPKRRASGYRDYSTETASVVRFIKRAQELGFTLRDVGELIALRDNRSQGRAEVRALASEKLTDIRNRIHCLRAMQRAMEELLNACNCNGSTPGCPIIEALDDES